MQKVRDVQLEDRLLSRLGSNTLIGCNVLLGVIEQDCGIAWHQGRHFERGDIYRPEWAVH